MSHRSDLPDELDRFLHRFADLVEDFARLHYTEISLDELADDPFIAFCLCGWESERSGDRSVVVAAADAHAGR